MGTFTLIVCAAVLWPLELVRRQLAVAVQDSPSILHVPGVVMGKIRQYLTKWSSGMSIWHILGYSLSWVAAAMFTVVLVASCINLLYVAFPIHLFFSDIGISVLRRDQEAALVGGFVVFIATLFRVLGTMR